MMAARHLRRVLTGWRANRRELPWPRPPGLISMPEVDTTGVDLATMAPGGLPAPMDQTVRRNREMFGLCDHFIELEDPWAGTYCKLLEGHDGPHTAHYPGRP